MAAIISYQSISLGHFRLSTLQRQGAMKWEKSLALQEKNIKCDEQKCCQIIHWISQSKYNKINIKSLKFIIKKSSDSKTIIKKWKNSSWCNKNIVVKKIEKKCFGWGFKILF